MIHPLATVDAALASSSGSTRRPDWVALAPVTSWRNSGRNTSAANSDSVVMNRTALTTTNTRSRNSRSGSTGSLARRSCTMKAPSRTSDATARPTICGELHA